jgi:hypothetical protein
MVQWINHINTFQCISSRICAYERNKININHFQQNQLISTFVNEYILYEQFICWNYINHYQIHHIIMHTIKAMITEWLRVCFDVVYLSSNVNRINISTAGTLVVWAVTAWSPPSRGRRLGGMKYINMYQHTWTEMNIWSWINIRVVLYAVFGFECTALCVRSFGFNTRVLFRRTFVSSYCDSINRFFGFGTFNAKCATF